MPMRPSDVILLRALSAAGEDDPGMELKMRRLAEERARSETAARDVDRLLIEELTARGLRLVELQHAHAELRNIQDELRATIEKLLAPPFREAIFWGDAEVADEPLAIVLQENTRRLVRTADDVPLETLVPGDTVYMTHSGNVVIADGAPPLASGEIAVVEGVQADGRLVIRRHGEEMVVLRAGRLRGVQVQPGDRVTLDSSKSVALEVLAPVRTERWTVREAPDVPRTRFAGLNAERDRILSRFVRTVIKPELAALYGVDTQRSLLLYGPPGCGKTTLMHIIASELGRAAGQPCRFAAINGAELESPWVGETQQNIHALFRELAAVPGPRLLFLDEVDAIGRIRGGVSGQHSDKFLSAWLTELDGLRGQRGLAIVAATNRRDLIDPAMLERLSAVELNVPRPGMAAARDIFRVHLPEHVPVFPNGAEAAESRAELINLAVTRLYAPNADNHLARLRFRDGHERAVAARDLMSGRVIHQICQTACDAACARHDAGLADGVRVEDIEDAVSDALDRMATLLSPRNVRSHIHDLPDDADVLAVERVQRRLRPARYRATPAHSAGA